MNKAKFLALITRLTLTSTFWKWLFNQNQE